MNTEKNCVKNVKPSVFKNEILKSTLRLSDLIAVLIFLNPLENDIGLSVANLDVS
jgi:hypothetical protein